MQKSFDTQYSNRPPENDETRWWREWICKIIFGLWHEKKAVLEHMGFPARPISQKEILKEVERRIEMLKDASLWGCTRDYPFWVEHNHNWIERRVNELVKADFGPRTREGSLKIICADKRKGQYEPNQKLFIRRD